MPVDEALARLLDGAEPAAAETVPLADAAGRVLAEPVEGVAHPAALPRLRHGRLCRARRRCGQRSGKADGDRHGRRPGNAASMARSARRSRAHLHRRAACPRAPIPSPSRRMREARRRRHRGVRSRWRPTGAYPRARGWISRKARRCWKKAACSMPQRFRLRPAANHPALPVVKKPLVAIIATGDELLPPGSDARTRPDHRLERLRRGGHRAQRPAPRARPRHRA